MTTPGQKIFIGIFFFTLGLGYLYRPDIIQRMNAVIREYLFNDAIMSLERRKWGMFFLLLSFLFLYLAYAQMYLIAR